MSDCTKKEKKIIQMSLIFLSGRERTSNCTTEYGGSNAAIMQQCHHLLETEEEKAEEGKKKQNQKTALNDLKQFE